MNGHVGVWKAAKAADGDGALQNGGFTLNLEEVAELVGVCPRTITRLVSKGSFPRPISLGTRKMWLRSAVLQHLQALHNEAQQAGGMAA